MSLPFPCGSNVFVSQAHHGVTHQLDDTWAWDFRLPEGFHVVAADEGIVRRVRGDSTRGGCHPSFSAEANYVVVSHENSHETLYLHLSRVVVAAGQRVKKGELLGYVGRTGYACGSHLHFKVAKAMSEHWNNPSVESTFRGQTRAASGMWLKAASCGGGARQTK